MVDLVTVSPEQLGPAAAASDGMAVLVFQPGGPLQSLAFDKLLSKLIATNLCKASKALLDGDLAYAADTVALVFNDPTATLNGWWRKTGASGGGAWEQFETLSLSARTLAEAAMRRAQLSVPFASWAGLLAATGMAAGDRAQVVSIDAGTHVDPVVGGLVKNAGVYAYSTAPAGWQRVADLDSQASFARQDTLIEALFPNTMKVGDATANSLPASLSHYWGTPPFTAPGPLREVQVETITGGTAILALVGHDGATEKVREHWFVNTTGGLDTFGDTTFNGVFVEPGDKVFLIPGTCGGLRYNPGGRAYRIAAGTDMSVGQVVTIEAQAATLSIQATARYVLETAAARPADQIVTTVRTCFAGTAPEDGWKLTGMAWSAGLTPSATGWNAARAVYDAPSSIANRIARVGVQLAATTDVPGLLFDCSQVEAYGAGVVLNGAAGALELYSVDASGTATLAASKALPGGFCVAGGEYAIEAIKNRLTWSWSVTRVVDGLRVDDRHVFMNTSAAADAARMHGAPGVACLAGAPTFTHFEHTVPVQASPHLAVYGDSNFEGSAIALTSPDGRQAWPYLLDDARGRRDVLIAARGGDETTSFMARMAADLIAWRPKNALLGLGTNDSGPQIWEPNLNLMVATARAVGAEPHLVTYPPFAAAQARINSYNAKVLSGAFGRYRVVDIAQAVTVNGDRVTPVPGYFNSDNLHMTLAGHRAVWAWIVANAPHLLEGARDDYFPGPLVPVRWKSIVPFSRLRLYGTGTITIDARDAAGAITTAVWSRTIAAADGLITFPFFGTAATALRASVTGNVYAELF